MLADARCSPSKKRGGVDSVTKKSTANSCSLPSSSRGRRRTSTSVVDRFQALQFGRKLSTESILQELLPNQKRVLLAAPLVHLSWRCDTKTVESEVTRALGVPSSTPHSRSRTKKRQSPQLNPLVVADCHFRVASAQSPSYHDYVMKIWEDKLRQHGLSMKDAVHLLVHEETVEVLESALFLQSAGIDMAQMMEVEMTLDQMDRRRLSTRFGQTRSSVSHELFQSVWRDGIAFHRWKEAPLLPYANSPDVRPLSPLRSPEFIRASSPVTHLLGTVVSALHAAQQKLRPNVVPSRPLGNQLVFARLRSDLQSSHEMLHRYGENVIQSSQWIQEHCVDEIIRQRSPLFQASRKNQAAAVLLNLLNRRIAIMQTDRLRIWQTSTQEQRCLEAVNRYCQLYDVPVDLSFRNAMLTVALCRKGAAKILALARRLLRLSLFSCWQRWKRRQMIERKMERLSSAIVIQSWMRCMLAKRRVTTYHFDRAATAVQSAWRGYRCRILRQRRRRYGAYTISACVVQRAFRAYHNRCQFAIHWRRHKASCCIARSLRRYCARRRLFKSWCTRVAQFHSAVIIQLSVRHWIDRVRTTRALETQQASSAIKLQRFFRYAHFILSFTSRVQRVTERQHAAAVTLQNAYRTKIARMRFHALKDQLEAQRRQEILKLMWDNAYATTIQRSWRKKRLQRWKHQQLQQARRPDGAM